MPAVLLRGKILAISTAFNAFKWTILRLRGKVSCLVHRGRIGVIEQFSFFQTDGTRRYSTARIELRFFIRFQIMV